MNLSGIKTIYKENRKAVNYVVAVLLTYLLIGIFEKYLARIPAVGNFIDDFTYSLTEQTAWLFDLITPWKFEVDPVKARLIVEGKDSVSVGSPCNGLSLLMLFTALIVFTKRNPAGMLWYIPMGLAIIHIVNILRIGALAVIYKLDPYLVDFNHKYVFQLLTYAVIFFLFVKWLKMNTDLSPEKDVDQN